MIPFELNKVHCGDALELMKQLPDNCIDLVLTDPPYNNLHVCGGGITDKRNFHKKIKSMGLDKIEILQYLEEIKRITVAFHGYFFSNKDMIKDYITFSEKNNYNWNILVVRKKNPFICKNNTYLPDREYILYIREKGKCYFNNDLDFNYYYGVKDVVCKKSETGHPTEKNIELIKNLLMVSSEEKNIILDCFAGSGNHLLACQKLNRKFIGFEKEPDYCQIANDRIQATTQGVTVNELKTGQDTLF